MSEKMTPDEFTEKRYEILLDTIDYTPYTAEELVRTDEILFPVSKLTHFSAKDLVYLMNSGKLTNKCKGAIKCSRIIKGVFSKEWTNNATVLTELFQLLPKNATFKDWKPYLLFLGIHHYRGENLLYFEELMELHRENKYCLSEQRLDHLKSLFLLCLTDDEETSIRKIVKNSYDGLNQQQIEANWDCLDKKQLLMSNSPMDRTSLLTLFDDPTVDNCWIWMYRHDLLKIDDMDTHEAMPGEWEAVCRYCKLTPQEMTKYRQYLLFDKIDYALYTADDLLRTEGILFPVKYLRGFSNEDLLKLFHERKLTKNRKTFGEYFDNREWPIWNALDVVENNAPFEKIKPFLLLSRLHSYKGHVPLTYDNLIELYEAAPNFLDVFGMTVLLENHKLDLTNEEWDGIIALISLNSSGTAHLENKYKNNFRRGDRYGRNFVNRL